MVREFYQAIELDKNMLRNECAKYEPVRNALSHPGELQADTRQAREKNFVEEARKDEIVIVVKKAETKSGKRRDDIFNNLCFRLQ